MHTYIQLYIQLHFVVFYYLFSVECPFPEVMFIDYHPSYLLFDEGSGIQHSLALSLHKIGSST